MLATNLIYKIHRAISQVKTGGIALLEALDLHVTSKTVFIQFLCKLQEIF